ncbi:MAG: MerR family transcriptional regulator [Oscillospiraceae bacterium]|nr:MerR family transcriptional regulator [Oscillospiraceae bacterium]
MYTVTELARLTGLTPRTLRYYDTIGLLRPQRNSGNDYRLYGPAEVDRLQQILLFRDMGLPLEEIGNLLDAPGFDRASALREHLERLRERRREVDALIRAVQNTLRTTEGGTAMNDQEKFEGMKRQAIAENESAYGRELREKHGEDAMDRYDQRLLGMTRQEWEQMQKDETAYKAALLQAVAAGDPAGEHAKEAVRLHAAWLAHYWPKGAVTPEAHAAVAEMYTQDRRFTDYYEQLAPGCAAFFAKAVAACYQA